VTFDSTPAAEDAAALIFEQVLLSPRLFFQLQISDRSGAVAVLVGYL